MTLIDEHTRECLALRVARRINAFGVIETLSDAMLERGIPEHVRCDNGPENGRQGAAPMAGQTRDQTALYRAGSPWENGYCESFNGKLRDECLMLGDLLQLQGGNGHDRCLEEPLQSRQAALLPELPAACARHHGDFNKLTSDGNDAATSSHIAQAKIPVRSSAT